MKVVSYILGGLLIVAGIACLFNPGSTVLATGYVMAILLLIYGIVGIINVIMKKTLPIFLLASIPAAIIGIIAIVRPGTTLVFDAFMAILFAAWFIVQGITTIVIAVQTRRVRRGWGFSLAIGIISVVVGIYSFVHPTISLVAIGILIGIYLIEAGIDLIVLTATVGSIQDFVKNAKDAFSGTPINPIDAEYKDVTDETDDNSSENE